MRFSFPAGREVKISLIPNYSNYTSPIMAQGGSRWTEEQEATLLREIKNGKSNSEIADVLGRTEVAIKGRLQIIAGKLSESGKTNDEIEAITKLSKSDVSSGIKKYKAAQSKKNTPKTKSEPAKSSGMETPRESPGTSSPSTTPLAPIGSSTKMSDILEELKNINTVLSDIVTVNKSVKQTMVELKDIMKNFTEMYRPEEE